MLATAVAMIAPSVASADIRTAVGTDPMGDSTGGPAQDLISAGAQYDTSGDLTVIATVASDIPSAPASAFSFTVASYVAPAECAGDSVTLTGASDAPSAAAFFPGVLDPASATTVVSGSSIAFSLSGPSAANKGWNCMTVVVTSKEDPAQILDQFSAPIFFAGFGPAAQQPAAPGSDKGGEDHSAPKGDLDGKKTQKLASTIAVSVTCLDEPCKSSTDGTVAVPRAGAKAKVYKIRKVTKAIVKGKMTKIIVKLPLGSRTAIRNALARGARVTALLKIVVADAAGNRRTLRRNIKLTL